MVAYEHNPFSSLNRDSQFARRTPSGFDVCATIAVKNADGTSTSWVMTLGSATALAQRGVGKTGPNALHAGDMVSVKFIPAKNGSPLGFLKSVTFPDGHVVQISAGNAND